MNWFEMKIYAVQWTGLSQDVLHVHAGLVAMFLIALLSRRPLSGPLPWLAVLVIITANECYDLYYEQWPERALQWEEGFKDFWNTMLEPTIILMLARLAPGLVCGRERIYVAASETDGVAGAA